MKKLLLCVFVLSTFATFAIAQIEKGAKMIGGNMSFAYRPGEQSHSLYAAINPFMEYLVTDDLAVGGSLQLSYSLSRFDGQLSKYSSIGFQPSIRYYVLPIENLKPFMYLGAGYLYTVSNSGLIRTYSGASAGGGVGATYFLNKHVGIMGTFGYSRSFPGGNAIGSSNFGLGFGFQIYVP